MPAAKTITTTYMSVAVHIETYIYIESPQHAHWNERRKKCSTTGKNIDTVGLFAGR